MDSSPILVTGASGTVGSRVVEALVRNGLSVRAATRHPAAAATRGLVEVVGFDFVDPSTFAAAFAGVQTMFLVRPPALARPSDLVPALQAALKAGVRHVVLLSVQGAEKLAVLPHARLERWLRSAGLGWTFLRPSFFDQNLITVHGPAVRRLDELVMPAGRGRTAFVDAVDVAEVAAIVLADPAPHLGCAYTLTGAEALTYGEVAGIMTAVCGRPIRYQQPGLLRYLVRARFELGLPPALVATTAVVYTTARLGLAAGLSDEAARLLGRPPVTMAEFIRREQEQFQPRPEDAAGRPRRVDDVETESAT